MIGLTIFSPLIIGYNIDCSCYITQKVIDAQGEGWLSADGLGILIIAAEVDDVGYYDVDLAEEPA